MKIHILAVGQKVPAWVELAWADYIKRFPSEFKPQLKAIKAEPRGGKTAAQLMAAEASRIDAAIPQGCRVVVLDERGSHLTTVALAKKMEAWQGDGRDCAWLIGGPDGLDPSLRQRADESVRLSDLTLPHAMVRVLLIEQLYRAWSIMTNHPYHRE
jgi:23S rRNA (pseudouridine1915-N3)-methyltransferase